MTRVTQEALRTFPVFKDLGEPVLARIAAAALAQNYAEGELVIGHTDTSFDVLLLVSGMARVSLYSADGRRVGFLEMPRGMMFGEISALDGLPRSVSVEAGEPSLIAKLPRNRFLELMEEHPAFAIAVARQLAGHVRRLTTRVFEFSTMAVRQRLWAELLRLAVPAREDADLAQIANLPTHAELASRISTHREAVSREMAWLDGKGLARKEGRNLLIPSLAAIHRLLEESQES